MKAVILAGGLGTRLRPLTYTTPKPMLPVANRPVLDYIIEKLALAGVAEAIITTNYLPKQIAEHAKKADYPIPVSVVEETKPLGTAGAVRNVMDELDGEFVVVQGDVISSLDLKEHLRLHRGLGTISLTEVDNPSAYGIAQLDRKGRIKKFVEKPAPGESFSGLANTGTYSLDSEALDFIPRGKADFSLDVFPVMLAEKKPLYGIVQKGYWKDVGSVDNYVLGNRYALGELGQGRLADKAFVSRNAKLLAPFIIGEGTQVGANVTIGPNTAIGKHCHLGSGAIIAGAILHDSVKVGSDCRIENCVIGDKTELGDGVFVGSRAILGSGCIIDRNAKIASNSVIGPVVRVQGNTEVSGVISPNLERIGKVSSLLSKIPVFKKLERNEMQVCMALVEFGELGKDVLGTVSKIPKEQLDRSLTHLEKLGIIRAEEGGFSLLYEEPDRIYDYLKRKLL